MTAQQPYTVVRAFPGFDVRRYPESVLVQVHVEGDFVRAAHRGFRQLQGYLAGANGSASTLAVTAPVLQEQALQSGHLISVVLPVGTDPDRLPVPVPEGLGIVAVPAHEAAVLGFTGRGAARFTEHGRELLGSVAAAELLPDGPVYFARYHPPFRTGFRSRNEALVRVTSA